MDRANTIQPSWICCPIHLMMSLRLRMTWFLNMLVPSISISMSYELGLPTNAGQRYVHPAQEACDTMKELRRTNIYYPYDSLAQYCLAKSLSTPQLPSATVIKAVAVEGADT